MFAHTRLEVINNALMKIGLPLAATLADCDWNASTVYDLVVEQCLRSFNWGFAGRFATLAENTQMPAHGYEHSYANHDHDSRASAALPALAVKRAGRGRRRNKRARPA